MKYCVSINNHLEEYRKKNNYTVIELAKFSDTTVNTIEKIESGEFVPPLVLCLLLSTILECSIEDIWELKEVKF